MKRYKVIQCFCMIILSMSLNSCEEADERYMHTDTGITAVYIRDEVGGTYVQGTFQGDDDIVFEVPLAKRADLDISNILIYANIPVSARVSPGFAGRHDLSSPKEFKVINDNNEPRTYTLQAIYLDY